MADDKRVFTAFAIEDHKLRTMLVGQRLHTDTPFQMGGPVREGALEFRMED